jgi:predicted Rossmann-fold nucleotide-binding protein
MDTFRVVVAGSRNIQNRTLIFTKLDKILGQKIQTHKVKIISGCAVGPDTLGAKWAFEHGQAVEKMPAEWGKFGKKAGMIRNRAMLESADAVICFHDGKSAGTKQMIEITKQSGKPIRIVEVKQ